MIDIEKSFNVAKIFAIQNAENITKRFRKAWTLKAYKKKVDTQGCTWISFCFESVKVLYFSSNIIHKKEVKININNCFLANQIRL